MDDLLPCPFCGSAAERITLDEPGDNFGGDVICCTRCQASSHVEFGRKENLVSRWNTRSSPPLPSDRMVEAVARALCGWTPNVTSWDDIGDNPKDGPKLQAIYHRDARAAIAAYLAAQEE